MRDYAKVAPTFWTGKTGKALRAKGPEALIVGMYLMSSPHSNMLGLYYQPLLYISHETGLGVEGASKGLQGAIEVGFCSFDEASEMIWVHEMAFFQVAAELKLGDKRCIGIQKDLDGLPNNPFSEAFFDKYESAFHLSNAMALQGPSKPLQSQEQEKEQEQEQELGANAPLPPAKLPTCQSQRIIDLFHEVLPELPAVRLMNDARKKSISSFWKFALTSKRSDGLARATDADSAMAWVRTYFEQARKNDFLMGRSPMSTGHENWKCDIDFLLSDKGKKHVIEKTKDEA